MLTSSSSDAVAIQSAAVVLGADGWIVGAFVGTSSVDSGCATAGAGLVEDGGANLAAIAFAFAFWLAICGRLVG